jgi:hypothetical protein
VPVSHDFNDEQLSGPQEAEVDQVLVEALREEPRFVTWLIQELYGSDPQSISLLDVEPNVVMSRLGETDVQVRIRCAPTRVLAVLVEDKIRAPAAPPIGGFDQDDRYLLRGERGRKQGLWEEFRTCLCAPQKYLDGRAQGSSYQSTLAHERLQVWFEQCDHSRANEWAMVMAASIESCRHGYVPILDEAAHSFSLEYWAYLREQHPEIQMSKPKDTPEGGS